MGTAVNVVAMVFGNLGEDSGTGVAFSRDPSTGERALYGEYLLNAQGEDVVSGQPHAAADHHAARTGCPASFQELERVARTLERHFRDLQDMEFTIERGKLFMLQTRAGTALRSGRGAHRLRDGGRGADLRGGGGRPHPAERSRTSCSTPPSIPTASSTCSPPACPLLPARRAARRYSTPTRRSGWAGPDSR